MDLSSFKSGECISINSFADLVGVSRATINRWIKNGTHSASYDNRGKAFFFLEDLKTIPEVQSMISSNWEKELAVKALKPYTSIELFAGAGGLALGLDKAGFKHLLLNEIEIDACRTILKNRPNWHVVNGDIRFLNLSRFKGKIDLLSGGFPCQAFSYAGKQGGFEDTRGTLFFEMAKAIETIEPRIVLAENVKGITSHDRGKTFATIKKTFEELGYTLIEPRVLKALMYKVPQKRERVFFVALRNDISKYVQEFRWPSPYHRIMTLRDAFFKGELYENDVPPSQGQVYPKRKQEVLDLVPMGGDWRDLPLDIQKEYLAGSYLLGGGKTGMARRLSLDEPSLTLTCSPAQKQTERCHPTETRPLTIREYARIQTFPDNWDFVGSMSSQYKQIGNAVPVNLAHAVGTSLIHLLNKIEEQNANLGGI